MSKKRVVQVLMSLVLLASLISGCGPFAGPRSFEIKANETAFLIPSFGDTSAQTKFDSAEALKARQVPSKFVKIAYTKEKVGRLPWDYKLIPTDVLILVDRTPVAREWTTETTTGTNTTNQAFQLDSEESIGFEHGAVISAIVTEEDAATFLYYFGGSAVKDDARSAAGTTITTISLATIVDLYVRNYFQGELYTAFKAKTLALGQNQADEIFTTVQETGKTYWKTYGITILSFGGSEGLTYNDENVQKAINDKFNAASLATQQSIANDKNIMKAGADATQTIIAAQAGAEALQLRGEQLAAYPSLVSYELATRSTGQVPQFLSIVGDPSAAAGQLPFGFFLNTPTAPAP